MNATYVLDKLLQNLWEKYRKRVTYAGQYESMVEARGGKVQNDHIAFRTFNAAVGDQPAGVHGIARIFLALGYEQKDLYLFADKKLTAWHYEHKRNPSYPKLFISQLEVADLSGGAADKIKETIAGAPDLLSEIDKTLLASLASGKAIDQKDAAALSEHLTQFFTRPWDPPKRDIVLAIDAESQYGAWTLLHGNSVNHFTAYINEQDVKEWPDIEVTVDALRKAGVPMKHEFEGERGTKLRQSSTQASVEDCVVLEKDGRIGRLEWSYAYYELAERGNIDGPDGKPTRFHGFLGAQATNLFEMTKRG